ncbi:hypothetical protein R5R35_010594 [Gryllus longicercus]|uniref:C-type lectin domain-containing protein n=1 Tax=Gryllus longicercus TaxID=2509291 RepID=A0AAN9VEF0_9ORTH
MAILLIQSTVDASDEAPSPVDHGEVLLVCNCFCEVNATSLQLLFCPPWRITSPTSTATRLTPTSDFAILPRPLYKFVGCESADTWHNANETCAKDGAYLAVPHSMSEVYMLLGMLIFHPHPGSNCSVFIGLHENGGEFRTVLGKPMPAVIMNLWDKRDVPKENHCLSLNREGRIEAESCEAGHAYACQVQSD